MRKLATAAAALAFALCAAGDNDRLVTDRDVRYSGEDLHDANVAMSCRLGAWQAEWDAKGIFKPDDYDLLLTKDEGVEVLVPHARKELLDQLRHEPKGTEVTLYGKVHWAKGIQAYLVIHDWKKGLSQPYDPKKAAEAAIVLTFGGKAYEMEQGKSYTVVTPKGERVEASWTGK